MRSIIAVKYIIQVIHPNAPPVCHHVIRVKASAQLTGAEDLMCIIWTTIYLHECRCLFGKHLFWKALVIYLPWSTTTLELILSLSCSTLCVWVFYFYLCEPQFPYLPKVVFVKGTYFSESWRSNQSRNFLSRMCQIPNWKHYYIIMLL